MSRSYHTTRRHLKEAKKSAFSNPEKKAAEVERIENQLGVKRLTKKLARLHRQARSTPPVTSIETIPITVTCDHPFAHFPASPDDLRAVLRLLPPGIADGLTSIELGLGKEAQSRPDDPLSLQPEEDPFLGRLGYVALPWVFRPRVLGDYVPGPARIRLFAYVYPPRLPKRRMWEFYLRLHMLMTFVHEVGHHFDRLARTARGRWRFDDSEKRERYAEDVLHRWVSEGLIPYLCDAYARDRENLRAWMRRHIGIEVPMEVLAGEVRSHSRSGTVFASAAFFNTAKAFEELVCALDLQRDPVKARLQFARDLHYAEQYETARKIVDAVLAHSPRDVEALALRGDILVHKKKHREAIREARRALSFDREDEDALEVLGDAYEELEEWGRLLKIAERLMVKWAGEYETRWALWYRARARLGLGQYDAALQDIEELEKIPGPSFKRQAKWLRKQFEKRAGTEES